jgi:hypothetical protein
MTRYLFTTEDQVNRIYSVETEELPYKGIVTVKLKNHDGYFTDKDLTGLFITVSWGAVVSGTPDYSTDPTHIVVFQKNVSEEGELLTVLTCFQVWQLLATSYIIAGSSRINASGPIQGDFNFTDIVDNQSNTAQATILYQGYAHLIVTDIIGTISPGDVLTARMNGAKLTVLSVNSTTGVIGAQLGWVGTTSIEDIVGEITAGKMDMVTDSEDAEHLWTGSTGYLPNYVIQLGTPVLTALKDLVDRTKQVLRLRYKATTPFLECHSLLPSDVVDATYYLTAPGHKFISNHQGRSVTIPNKVYVVGAELDDTGVIPVGEDSDADSIAKIGEYPILVTVALKNTEHTLAEAEATKYAESLMAQQRLDSNTGQAVVPMHPGQEMYDYVNIVDTRMGRNVYGWVTGIRRQWKQGQSMDAIDDGGRDHFSMELTIGNESSLSIDRFRPQPIPQYHGGTRLMRDIPQQVVITTVSDCWYWDVLASGEPPATWMNTGYDHTSWGDAVEGDDTVYGSVDGAQSIWAPDVASPQEVCFIQTFNIDQGEAVAAYLDIKWCDILLGVWINGHLVIEEQPATILEIGMGIDVSILPPGDNKIAVRVRNLSTYADYFVSYKLTINRAEEVTGSDVTTVIGTPGEGTTVVHDGTDYVPVQMIDMGEVLP